jgi:hypothetical protein
MKRYAPLLTLVAVVILGAALFTLSSINNPANQAAEQAQAAAPPPPAEAAPPPPAVAPPVVAEKAYAGRSTDRRMTIAIAVKDGKAIAYVCDGKKIEAWLDGTLQGDTLALTGKGGASVTGTANEQSAEGEIVIAGKTWKYTAKGVEAPAGLYEGRADVRGVATRIGWVVEPDGQVTGIQQADGQTSPAPPLDPADPDGVTIDGVTVTVTSLDGSTPVVTR